MEKDKSSQNIIDIHEARREYFKSNRVYLFRILIFVVPLFFLIVSIFWFRYQNIFKSRSLKSAFDEKVLGHLPYVEISKDNLVVVKPNILVHKDMYESLMRMKVEAEKDGIFLVFLSGFRSIKLQEEIFYTLKSSRNQNAIERAKVSAPPGYSEHSTGFAIDIGDYQNRKTDFDVSFEDTAAFKWLKRNAAKYHFRLSFDKNHNSVDYEPWHWRYEGSIEALRIFEKANRKKNIF